MCWHCIYSYCNGYILQKITTTHHMRRHVIYSCFFAPFWLKLKMPGCNYYYFCSERLRMLFISWSGGFNQNPFSALHFSQTEYATGPSLIIGRPKGSFTQKIKDKHNVRAERALQWRIFMARLSLFVLVCRGNLLSRHACGLLYSLIKGFLQGSLERRVQPFAMWAFRFFKSPHGLNIDQRCSSCLFAFVKLKDPNESKSVWLCTAACNTGMNVLTAEFSRTWQSRLRHPSSSAELRTSWTDNYYQFRGDGFSTVNAHRVFESRRKLFEFLLPYRLLYAFLQHLHSLFTVVIYASRVSVIFVP